MTLAIILGFLAIMAISLFACQRKLIYFPQPYEKGEPFLKRPRLERIEYKTSSGSQTAFYLPPADRAATGPQSLWVAFCGNASLSLYWLDTFNDYPDTRTGFMMIDYPGYGLNEGHPTRDSIIDASTAAMAAWRSAHPSFAPSLKIIGHSLGTAAVLELAVRESPSQIILISPFTSLMAMARRSVGWPLCLLLRDRFDNLARLNELAQRSPRPSVTIIHGSDDNIVPFTMGRELAGSHNDWITFHEVTNGDHNWIIESARPLIIRSMTADESAGNQSVTH